MVGIIIVLLFCRLEVNCLLFPNPHKQKCKLPGSQVALAFGFDYFLYSTRHHKLTKTKQKFRQTGLGPLCKGSTALLANDFPHYLLPMPPPPQRLQPDASSHATISSRRRSASQTRHGAVTTGYRRSRRRVRDQGHPRTLARTTFFVFHKQLLLIEK